VQFDRFDDSASKIFTVGAGHGQQGELLTSLLVYVLRSLALAIENGSAFFSLSSQHNGKTQRRLATSNSVPAAFARPLP
ncbi:hypothetical protein, partial [Alkalinema sp. FACHB-956]|uniref:hypothetical protein n=1 Tax=Alkalinema sp. FACHB-956 TaxID=2692768 RepID=UPI001A7E60BD